MPPILLLGSLSRVKGCIFYFFLFFLHCHCLRFVASFFREKFQQHFNFSTFIFFNFSFFSLHQCWPQQISLLAARLSFPIFIFFLYKVVKGFIACLLSRSFLFPNKISNFSHFCFYLLYPIGQRFHCWLALPPKYSSVFPLLFLFSFSSLSIKVAKGSIAGLLSLFFQRKVPTFHIFVFPPLSKWPKVSLLVRSSSKWQFCHSTFFFFFFSIKVPKGFIASSFCGWAQMFLRLSPTVHAFCWWAPMFLLLSPPVHAGWATRVSAAGNKTEPLFQLSPYFNWATRVSAAGNKTEPLFWLSHQPQEFPRLGIKLSPYFGWALISTEPYNSSHKSFRGWE